MDKSVQIDTFCRFTQVSRETIKSLASYENKLINANKKLNLIGNSTIEQIWSRHFLDSSQVIDFIDKNDHTILDFGTGAGFPGLVVAIIAKDKKIPLKVKLIEKSNKKIEFLKKIIGELSLDVDLVHKNVLTQDIKLEADVLVARAFKPLGVFLQLIHKRGRNWKKIIIFLGKTGQAEIVHASKDWDIEYKQRMSITSSDSALMAINKLRKK